MTTNALMVLASAFLLLHLLWIGWVILGCLVTRRHRVLALLHIGSLAYTIVIEVGPWSCPLTVAEQWLERQAGRASYEGGFLVHYLEKIVYPNVSPQLLVGSAVAVCLFTLAVYSRRFSRARRPGASALGRPQ